MGRGRRRESRAGGLSGRRRRWRRLVERWERSGLSQATFCRQQGLRYERFLWWRKRFGGKPAAVARRKGLGASRSGPKLEFVPVRLKVPEAVTAGSDWGCELVMGAGTRVRLRREPDPELLLRIVGVLRQGVG